MALCAILAVKFHRRERPISTPSRAPRRTPSDATIIWHAQVRRTPMGNIRQTYIKRVAVELVRHYPDQFNGDFSHNKQKVLEYTDLGTIVDGKMHVEQKKLANRIAGYTVRYVTRKRGI